MDWPVGSVPTNAKGTSRSMVDKFDLLCIVGLILSFLLVSRLPAAPSKFGDIYFHDEAKALAHALRGAGPWSEVAFARAPGPALYYAVPYLFVSPSAPDGVYWRAALLWNGLWMAMAILLNRRAGEHLHGDLAGKIAAIISLVLPLGVYYSFGVAAETPAYVATVVFVFGWAYWRAGRDTALLSRGALVALFGLFGLILCRPNALIISGIAGLAFAAMLLQREAPYTTAEKRFAAAGAVAGIAILFFVSATLKEISGKRGVSTQASNFDTTLFLSNFQFRTEPFDWRFWGKGTRQGSADYQNYARTQKELEQESMQAGVPVSHLQVEWTRRDVAEHPWLHIKMTAVRALSLNIWLVNSTRPSAFHLGPFRGVAAYFTFHILLNIVVLTPLFLSFAFLATNREEFFAYWPLWGLWLGLLVFHAVTYAEPRYMLPAQPGLAVMAACMLARRRDVLPGSVPLSARGSELLCP
jgi:hypothetical protein